MRADISSGVDNWANISSHPPATELQYCDDPYSFRIADIESKLAHPLLNLFAYYEINNKTCSQKRDYKQEKRARHEPGSEKRKNNFAMEPAWRSKVARLGSISTRATTTPKAPHAPSTSTVLWSVKVRGS
jgi:hypothetical protein